MVDIFTGIIKPYFKKVANKKDILSKKWHVFALKSFNQYNNFI